MDHFRQIVTSEPVAYGYLFDLSIHNAYIC